MLDQIKIASPCDADWNAMQGDDRVRFCAHCQKNVYNLSALTRRDAEALIREKEGNLCARFYRRADGTVLTQDCPVGLKAKITRRISWVAASAMTIATAWAQTPATLTGKVMDASGAIIPDATVEVTEKSTGALAKARTDATGQFRINPPSPGEYKMVVSRPGFMLFISQVALTPEAPATVDVTLHLSPQIGEVILTSEEPSLFAIIPTARGLDLPEPSLPALPPTPKKVKPWWRRIL